MNEREDVKTPLSLSLSLLLLPNGFVSEKGVQTLLLSERIDDVGAKHRIPR